MSPGGTSRQFHRRGFTLLEAMMSSGILFVVVLAVTSAIVAGQQSSLEARDRIAATLAAEDLAGRLVGVSYDDLDGWDGYTEAIGTMTTTADEDFPASFDTIGRSVAVTADSKNIAALDVDIDGRLVTVEAFDSDGRVLACLERFIPEPAARTIE